MNLQEKIECDMREAMKNRDKKVNILKYMMSEFSRRPNLNVSLSDKEVISIIRKYIKSVEETIALTGKKTEEQEFEIEVLSSYIPKMAEESEIREWIENNITLTENKSARMKEMGKIMKNFEGRVDGNVVKNILMSL